MLSNEEARAKYDESGKDGLEKSMSFMDASTIYAVSETLLLNILLLYTTTLNSRLFYFGKEEPQTGIYAVSEVRLLYYTTIRYYYNILLYYAQD